MITRLRAWRAARLSILAAVAALVVSIPVGPWLVRDQAVASPDAILVLASHEFERLPHAVALARQWPSAKVLLTEPVVVTQYNCHDCSQRVATLERTGVDADRIEILMPRVRNTHDELEAVSGWLRRNGHRRVLVVTSPYHTRRVRGLAVRFVSGDVGVSACPVVGGLAWPWWRRRYDRRYVVYEAVAIVNNAWRYGVPLRTWLVM